MTLEIKSLYVEVDGVAIVTDVSLSVAPGGMTAILGANGAGKSELVLGIAGVLSVPSGSVVVAGKELAGSAPEIVRQSGVAVVPEGHQVLSRLTVRDNLRAAGSIFGNMDQDVSKVLELFPELEPLLDQEAGTLSGGQQQMVALGHALMADPKYLVLDEMSLGLAPVIVSRLMNAIAELRQRGVGVLLIEQFTELALKNADYAVVMRQGALSYEGSPADLQSDEALLRKAYFG